ncbi:hypothetical protein [Nocardia rhamnosiphila]|uniref:hypothetical protein n=1 Tax=Nocardia rhamnosiphila TaxID=426716 RepID=UPI0004C41983|nr:hypothetical protein [Nocardia rhamnosiphila]
MATTCLTDRRLVIVEGILDADRYGAALQRIAGHAQRALFYAWDLDTTIDRILGDSTTHPDPLADAPLPPAGPRGSGENALGAAVRGSTRL